MYERKTNKKKGEKIKKKLSFFFFFKTNQVKNLSARPGEDVAMRWKNGIILLMFC